MIFQTIWTDVVSLCREHPELLIFFSLAIGYAVGKIKVFGFSLGSTASVLLTALVVGQLDVEITPLIKSISFTLFIFTIGYKVGPQFFGGLKKEGLKYLILSVVFAVIGLLTAIVLGKLFRFSGATTAGLLAGALTQSSVIGTAEGAVRMLHLDAAHQKLLDSEIAVAYAITYIFGVAGLILFYKIVPRLLRIDLKAQAKKVEAELSDKSESKNATSTERDTNETDIIMVSFGCFLGTLLGLALVHIGPVALTLGVGGGVLLFGLILGWLQANYPVFGGIPAAAQWLLSDLGLNLFIACVGLTAGPRAIHAFQEQGVTLLLAGIILTLTPHILSMIFGFLVLRLNPALLFGALTGAGTATPSLNVLKEESDSSVPVLGYTVPYAIGNFILTIWGTVIMNLM